MLKTLVVFAALMVTSVLVLPTVSLAAQRV
jgi:hypothetical protein